ncbi:MAG: hypothetical protein WBD58_01535, partial [Geitlerinemataceae cyanobacterium]
KFYRGRGRSRRNLLEQRETIPILVENHIHNHNQQEKEMSHDKQQNLYDDRVRGDRFTENSAGDAIAAHPVVTSQNLADAAAEIQELMARLSQMYTTDTKADKNKFTNEIVRLIDEDPSLSQRLLSASKTGAIAEIEQFFNHPLSSFVIAALEDWRNTKV